MRSGDICIICELSTYFQKELRKNNAVVEIVPTYAYTLYNMYIGAHDIAEFYSDIARDLNWHRMSDTIFYRIQV